MHFEPDEIYHVYNRGNNKQLIFFNDGNYIFFLKKIRHEWKKYCEILCYSLIPNHFHFMLMPNKEGCKNIILADIVTHMQNLSKAIGKTLSSNTKAINIQNHTTGNLFQKKTQAKNLTNIKVDTSYKNEYLLNCFHYIHQNSLLADLVKNIKDWQYSSYPDYYNLRNGTLCDKNLTINLLSFSETDFQNEEIVNLKKEAISKIF